MITTKLTLLLSTLLFLGTSFFISCSEDQIPETNTESFICFENDSLLLSTRVVDEITLPVLVCASPHYKAITVNFEVSADELTEGIDYSVSNTSTTLNFPVGIYNDTITVRFLKPIEIENEIKVITLRLIDNSIEYTLGYPGVDHNNQAVNLYLVK